MNNITYEEGYKEFAINNDESRILRFNPADIALVDRIRNELNKVVEYTDQIKEDKDNFDLSVELDKEIRKHIDEMFYEGASEIIFENQNVLTTVNGTSIFERFFKALLHVMEPYVKKDGRKSHDKIEKYRKQHARIIAENSDDQ